jgi:xanthine dehydrogenase YagS FAD-binding subunit
MNVASAMRVSAGAIEQIRIAVNGAAARPLRLRRVEEAVRGKPTSAETGEMAGRLAVEGAVPLQFNAYKIPLMRNLVKRSITGIAGRDQSRTAMSAPDHQEAAWAF